MPAATGSLPIPNTIGIVEVAAFAARAEASPPTPSSTATRRLTSSAASRAVSIDRIAFGALPAGLQVIEFLGSGVAGLVLREDY